MKLTPTTTRSQGYLAVTFALYPESTPEELQLTYVFPSGAVDTKSCVTSLAGSR